MIERKLNIGDRVIPKAGKFSEYTGMIAHLEYREENKKAVHIEVDFPNGETRLFAENELTKEGASEQNKW